MAALLDDGNAMMIAANFVRGKSASGEEEEPASAFQLIVRWTQISKLFPTRLIQTLVVSMEHKCFFFVPSAQAYRSTIQISPRKSQQRVNLRHSQSASRDRQVRAGRRRAAQGQP